MNTPGGRSEHVRIKGTSARGCRCTVCLDADRGCVLASRLAPDYFEEHSPTARRSSSSSNGLATQSSPLGARSSDPDMNTIFRLG